MSQEFAYERKASKVATAFRLKDGCESYWGKDWKHHLKSQPPFG